MKTLFYLPASAVDLVIRGMQRLWGGNRWHAVVLFVSLAGGVMVLLLDRSDDLAWLLSAPVIAWHAHKATRSTGEPLLVTGTSNPEVESRRALSCGLAWFFLAGSLTLVSIGQIPGVSMWLFTELAMLAALSDRDGPGEGVPVTKRVWSFITRPWQPTPVAA